MFESAPETNQYLAMKVKFILAATIGALTWFYSCLTS